MVDAAKTVVDYFAKKGGIAYINVMKNMSVDCDCCSKAEDPCLQDVGILASLDPVAIDKACLDLVEQGDDPGKAHFMERVNTRDGKHYLHESGRLGLGSLDYELVCLD